MIKYFDEFMLILRVLWCINGFWVYDDEGGIYMYYMWWIV